MNAEWHRQNPMPRNATTEQRIAWHNEHARYCACRPIPPKLKGLMDRNAGTDARPSRAGEIRALLSGGDRRSIADSNRARALIEREPSRVGELAALTRDGNWLVVQRALDLLEKLAHDHADWVEPYKKVFIGRLSRADQWEIRLQIVRALPLFRWTSAETKRVEAILLDNVSFPQTFVRAWALDSLASLAQTRPKLMPSVRRYLREFERSPSKALQARARKIRARLVVPSRARRSPTERAAEAPRIRGRAARGASRS